MSAPLRLRADTYHAATAEGVALLTHRGILTLSGPGAAWTTRLLPHLDDSHTEADLINAVPPDRRPALREVLAGLRRHGALTEAPEPPGPPGDGADTAPNREPEDRFLSHTGGLEAAGAWASYRAASVAAIAPQRTLTPLVRAALRSGLLDVSAAPLSDAGPAPEWSRETWRRWCREPAQNLRRYDGPREAEAIADRFSAVLAIADTRAAGRLERACRAAGTPLALLVLDAEHAWLLPPRPAEPEAPGWRDLELRRAAVLRSGGPHPKGPGSPGDGGKAAAGSTTTAETVMASRLVHSAMRGLTGAATRRKTPDMVRIERATLASYGSSCLPHPRTRSAAADTEAEFRQRIARLARGEPIGMADFSRRAAPLIDPQLGPIELGEADLPQLPLNLCRARARAIPEAPKCGPPPPVRFGGGFDPEQARCSAALAALADHCAHHLDPRRMLTAEGTAHPALSEDSAADPQHAAAELHGGFLWGFEVDAPDRLRLVPASAVRAAPCRVAGHSWRQALTTALFDHMCREASAAPGRAAPGRRIDPTGIALDSAGTRCRDHLAGLAGLPEVDDLSEARGPTVLALRQGATLVGCATGADAASALSTGLVRLVMRDQLPPEARGGSCHASLGTPRTEPVPRPEGDGTHRPTAGSAADRSPDPQRTAALLRRRGKVAVAVPLDHDPATAAILPYIVSVVMFDA
ncbi:hypothetical protein [Nocardiopsis chromatogenes]|uniref:hypothetical protein n=1 Tax=Nocardiopsis chromatogenes TaxID=280239 RepID=UPI0003481DF9|nr:hypothetical protein [Nocardiopsis chromatogenes]